MRRILVALVSALLLGLAAFMLFVVSIVHVANHAPAVYSSGRCADLAAQRVVIKQQLCRADANLAALLHLQDQAVARALSNCS